MTEDTPSREAAEQLMDDLGDLEEAWEGVYFSTYELREWARGQAQAQLSEDDDALSGVEEDIEAGKVLWDGEGRARALSGLQEALAAHLAAEKIMLKIAAALRADITGALRADGPAVLGPETAASHLAVTQDGSHLAVTPDRQPETLDRGDRHTCPFCGQLFTGVRSDAGYCSPRCRQAAYRARLAGSPDLLGDDLGAGGWERVEGGWERVEGRGKRGVSQKVTTVAHDPEGWRVKPNTYGYPGFELCSLVERNDDGRPPCDVPPVWRVEVLHRHLMAAFYYCDADLPAQYCPDTRDT